MSGKGKSGQTYNLNLAGSDILASDGRGNWHISPKCYTRPTFIHHICRSFHSSFKLKYPSCPFHFLQKSPQTCLNRLRRTR
jgi:hypothetical protein